MIVLTQNTDHEIFHKMYKGHKISLVIPAFREERRIAKTLAHVPEYIDSIFVIDDKSPDNQAAVVRACAKLDSRITLLSHTENKGPGAAIITGYEESLSRGFDIALVVGGDHQMDLSEAPSFLDPIIENKADYVKGNRFCKEELSLTLKNMPPIRIAANLVLTFLTRALSGNWKLLDVVDGYTAISKTAIRSVDWSQAWGQYGYPIDFIIRLQAHGIRIGEVRRTAIYTPGERQSQIKALPYLWNVFNIMLRLLYWKLENRRLRTPLQPKEQPL